MRQPARSLSVSTLGSYGVKRDDGLDCASLSALSVSTLGSYGVKLFSRGRESVDIKLSVSTLGSYGVKLPDLCDQPEKFMTFSIHSWIVWGETWRSAPALLQRA